MIDLSLLAPAPALYFAIGAIAVLAVAISKAGFGGALGSLSMPILLLIYSPTLALGILLPLFIVIDIWVVWVWRHSGVKRIILIMTITGLLGQLLGWALLRLGVINDRILLLLIGLLALYTSIRYFAKLLYEKPSAKALRDVICYYRHHLIKRAALWCSLSGFSSFVSLTGGIPAQIYLLPLGLPRQLFVSTMAWYLFFINLAKIPFFTDLDFIDARTLTLSALLLPIVPLGIMIGRWLNNAMTDKIFYIVTHAMLLLLGLQIVWRYFYGVI